MIIHKHPDGSEGYQYEIGDRVIVTTTIQGGWFNLGPERSEKCVVKHIDLRNNWQIAKLDIHYSDEWGPAEAFPWMVQPHADAVEVAKTVLVGALPVPEPEVLDPREAQR